MENALKEIITKYPNALEDDKKLKAFLKDYIPENKLMQNMLMMAYDSGIVSDIRHRNELDKFQMYGYIKCLVNEYGITEKAANTTIEQWATALDIEFEEVTVQEEPVKKVKKTGDVIDYSDMSIDDFDITGKVIRFSGKGPKVVPNVEIKDGTYIVKAKNCNAELYDNRGKSRFITVAKYESYKEDMFQTSYLEIRKPVIVKFDSDDKWELELIPM